ncbi:hypothetical protein EfmAA610_20570 [Enterococcus faecium]|nr:hypothetical protein EfmAA610_20570 [Enterococcus faecium]
MDIICYEKADKVHRRLKNYHDSRIHICDLPELGDLGQTVYFGLSDEDEPVLINFADTIVMESMSKGYWLRRRDSVGYQQAERYTS